MIFFKRNNKIEEAQKEFKEACSKTKCLLEGLSSPELSDISHKSLSELEPNIWYYLPDRKVRFSLKKKEGHTLTFITELEAGGSFGLHRHDCTENGIVLKGNLIDKGNNLMLLENEEWKYKKNQSHNTTCTVKSVYHVEFSK